MKTNIYYVIFKEKLDVVSNTIEKAQERLFNKKTYRETCCDTSS
tara:strand:+ start:373 stop:504 length:132 start_codon:yes stop_codon:yes gene_type:complete